MNRIRFALCLSVMAFMACVLGHAQTGTIQGTVTDKSGAVIQDADITVTNLNTNQARATKTNETGGYSLPSLAVGPYSITVAKGGFRMFKVDSVTLTVAQSLTVNASLEAGATSEEVQVRGDEIPPVDLDTAQVSNLVDSRQMQELPLITRDPYSLVLLSPGTSQTNANGGFSVNGGRDRNNNFLLDGVDNNDTSVPGIPDGLLSANPDSTQEFRVITDNFNPEYGRNTGAIIDVATKSGTNSLHGGVREFGRWNSFGGARDWFNPRVDPATGQINPMNPYVRNQFGFNIGGPIIKNKTFFFFDEEFQRFRTTLTSSVVAPTAAFKSGVFMYKGAPVDLINANNYYGLPPDATMQNIFALYPTATPAQSQDGISGIVHFPSSSKLDAYNPVAKIDHQFSSKHALSMRYAYNHFADPNPFHDEFLPNGVGGVSTKGITQGATAHLTSTLKPTLVNDFAFGWNRLYDFFGCNGTSVFDSVSPLDQFGNGIDYIMGPFTSFGCLNLLANYQWRKTGTTSYGDGLSWAKGSHMFKFGGDFRNVVEQGPNNFLSRRELALDTFLNTGFSLISCTDPINCVPVQAPPATDDVALEDAASAFYGFAWEDLAGEFFDKNGVRQGTDNKHFRQHEYDWYGQDTWKVRRNLTLTYGLRYQLDGVPYEENANFSNLLTNPGSLLAGQSVTMTIVGPGTGHQLYKTDYSNIEPRLGISWDPWGDGKTAVRGAFGIFHDRVFGNLFGNARGNPPFEQDYINFPFETINDAFGSGQVPPVVQTTTPSAVISDGSGLAPVIFDTNFRNLVSNNWNLDIQRELPGSNAIDIAYVGTESHHLYRQVDGNPPDPTLVKDLVAYCSAPNPQNCTPDDVIKTNLYFGADFGVLPFNAVKNNALFQPFYQRSIGNGIYHALQTKFTHRMSHGLQLQGAYTWAHAIDDAPDPLVPAAGNRTFPRNSRNLSEERGNSDYDVRHRFVLNYIYELPFGKGKGFLNNGVVGKIFEGWQLSGITTVQTGHPFDVFSSTDMERSGLSGRADLVPGQDPFSTSGPNTITQADNPGEKIWFRNPDAFSGRTDGSGAPTYIGPGTLGRNHFYGPSYVNFDMSWAKSTSFGERVKLQLRVECYNIFNHPQFNNPGNGITSTSTFGLITGTISQPDGTTSARQIQVGAKLNF